MLHEVVTEMVIALDLDWLAKSYINFLLKFGITPGFETRNFFWLVNKLKKWNIDLDKILIAAPFNKVGFQMNPSMKDCEEALDSLSTSCLIAFGILGAGYLAPEEAIKYVANLPNLRGVAVGVSKMKHAKSTFSILSRELV